MATRPVLRLLEAACWTVGAAMLFVYGAARLHGEAGRRQAIADFTLAAWIEAGTGPSPRGAVTVGRGAHEIGPATQAAPARALLRIPRLGLEVPVFADGSAHNLNRGAGLVDPPVPADGSGNIAIAAHRDGYFRPLRLAEVGDVVELEGIGPPRRYRIESLKVVEPTDLSPLAATPGPALTLITCYPFWFAGNAPQRYIVRAVSVPGHEVATGGAGRPLQAGARRRRVSMVAHQQE